jgi:hypothetical protein
MIELIIASLCFSTAINLGLVFYISNLKKQIKKPKPDLNAQEVLSELMAGPALIRVEVIERDSLIQWRPTR